MTATTTINNHLFGKSHTKNMHSRVIDKPIRPFIMQNKQIFTGHGNCYNDTPYHVMENLRYEQTD